MESKYELIRLVLGRCPKRCDTSLEFLRDLLRIRPCRKFHGLTDVHLDAARAVEAAARFTDFVRTINAHRHDWKLKIACQQADACAKGLQLSVRRQVAFGKYEQAIAPVGEFAGKAKAFAKTGTLGQRKDVEQADDQKIIHAMQPAAQKKPFGWRSAHLRQALAAHRDRQAVPQSRRQRRQ